jgi:hypothetical protein
MEEDSVSSASSRATAAAGAPAAPGDVVRCFRRVFSFDSTSVREDCISAFILEVCAEGARAL